MGLFKNAMRKGIPGRDSVGGMGSAMARPAPPRPTLIQGGPAYFTPEGYRPPMQPEQAFMPTDTMGDPIGDMFRRQLPPVRNQLPRMPPPRDPRDDFISIGGVGGNDGINDPRMQPMPEPPADPRDYMPRDPAAGMIATPAPTPPEMGGGTADMMVMVYGPDGKMYSSPGAARRAGVTDFSMTNPNSKPFPTDFMDAYKPPEEPAPMAPPLPNLGGTPIANDGTLGDLPPGLRMSEQPVSNDSDRFFRDIQPIRQDLLPPKRGDFMSIGREGDDRTAFENQLKPQRPTAIAIGESAPTNTDIDKQRALLQAQNIDMTGGLGSNNFLTNRIGDGGTPTPPDTGMLDPNTRISNYYTDRQFDAVPVNAQPAPFVPPQQPAPISPPQDMMDLPVSNNQTPLTQPIANPRNPEMFAEIQKRINDLGATSLNQDLAPIQQMPMMPELPRMPMPAPIATPMPMSPIDLPRLDLQELDSMDRQMSISRDFMPSRNLSLANKPMLMPLESRMPMMPRRRGR